MKSQGLPIRTIVIVIMILIALAVVILFSIESTSRSKAGVDEQATLSKCNSICAKISAIAQTKDDVISIATEEGFCDLNCPDYITCTPDLCSGALTCSGNTPVCS